MCAVALQPRIFYSMARDGLLPPWAAKVHPKYHTPHITTILTGIFVGGFAAIAPIGVVIELTNIGTLFAFVLVCAGVMILRWRRPADARGFRMPLGWLTAPLGAGFCVWLALGLPPVTWVRFLVWLGAGLVIYFLYGFRRSVLQAAPAATDR